MTILNELQEHLNVAAAEHAVLRAWFEEDLGKTFAHHNVAATPMLLLLAEDVLTHLMLVANLHRQLNQAEAANQKEATAALETLFKAREKLRRSIGDLQAACAAAGTPVVTGLSSLYASIKPKMEGVIEAALAYRQAHPVESADHTGWPLTGPREDMQAVPWPANEETAPDEEPAPDSFGALTDRGDEA